MSRFSSGNSKDFTKSSSTTTRKSIPAPSIEFSVTCEEGIHLFVDMNSSLMDWNKRFENEVGTCCSYQMNKFGSFREELQYLGYKFELRKSSLVSDTNSSSKMDFEDGNFDSRRHSAVTHDDSSSFLYPDAKSEYSDILVQEKCYFQGVAEHLEQEGENSVSSCVNSVANKLLVDANSNVRHEVMKFLGPNSFNGSLGKLTFCTMGLSVGDGSGTPFDDKDLMLLNENTVTDIRAGWNSGKNKSSFSSSSISETEILLSNNGSLLKDTQPSVVKKEISLNSVDEKAFNSSYDRQVMHQPATRATSSLNLQKRSEKLKTGGERKRRKHVIQSDMICGQYGGRTLRSAKRHRRQSYPRKCKLEKFK